MRTDTVAYDLYSTRPATHSRPKMVLIYTGSGELHNAHARVASTALRIIINDYCVYRVRFFLINILTLKNIFLNINLNRNLK